MFVRALRGACGVIRYFEIDSRGNIRCTLNDDYEVPLRLQGTKKKYCQVQLIRGGSVKWYYVHRLMAYSWFGNPPHSLRRIVDHINGNSQDNCIDNLRWVTSTANNISKACLGIVEREGVWAPRVAGYTHWRYGSNDRDIAKLMRDTLVEAYVRYNCRFPENGNRFPHSSMHRY